MNKLINFFLTLVIVFLAAIVGGVYAVDCTVPIGGDATLTSSCSFTGTVNGVDEGAGTGDYSNTAILTINDGVQLTINSNQIITAGSIDLIGSNSKVVVQKGGKLYIKAPILMANGDADDAPTNTTQATQSALITGTPVRRNTLTTLTADCNDGNGNIFQTKTVGTDYDGTAPQGDGYITEASAVSTCVGKSETQAGLTARTVNGAQRAYFTVDGGLSYNKLGTSYVLGVSDCDSNDKEKWVNRSCWYDADQDGYGMNWTGSKCKGTSCASPWETTGGQALWNGSAYNDCNDNLATQHTIQTCYYDSDNDGPGRSNNYHTDCCRGSSCSQGNDSMCGVTNVGNSYDTNDNSDCDDTNGAIWYGGDCYTNADGDAYYGTNTAWVCRGPSACQAGYSTTPGADCYDSNANARPNQGSYFTSNRGDGSFDYNCSSTETKDPAYNCSTNLPAAACYSYWYKDNGMPASNNYQSGYYGGIPACGAYGNYRRVQQTNDAACANGGQIRYNCGDYASWTYVSGWLIVNYPSSRQMPCQ